MTAASRWLCLLAVILACGLTDANQDVPLTKFGSKTGPTLKFFYCYSCGYNKVYREYVSIIEDKYPVFDIAGEHYNPPGFHMHFAKILNVLKYLLILLIVCGVEIARPVPAVWRWCIDNRFYSCIMIFCICNAIEMQLISSGAFEIHFNDVPIWSKLETGRIPQPPELFDIIDAHLRMQYPDMQPGHVTFGH